MKQKKTTAKNPAKVAAGKARAQKAVRLNGKFVTKYFQDNLQEDADAVGYTGNLQKFLDEHEIVYSNLYDTGELQGIIPKADSTLFKEAESYQGKLILRINGEDKAVSLDKFKYEVLRVEQALMSTESCAGVAFQPILTFNGKMIIELPDVSELDEDEADLQEIMDTFTTLTIYISEKKKKRRAEFEQKKERKIKAINKKLRDVKTKSRTKSRRR
jgi:hypothetical protein